MIPRFLEHKIKELIKSFPAVGIIGPRQTGKTTLSKKIAANKSSLYIDLELKEGYSRLSDAETYLRQHQDKLIIIDEVQRMPGLFPVLRGLIDENRKPGRFLLLGSASPLLLRKSSESLAGRIAYQEMFPLILSEIESDFPMEQLWIKGGFPDAFTGKLPWHNWMNSFVVSYLEKDLPQMGFPASRFLSERLWTMLANSQGSTVNYSDFAKSLEISSHTVKKYIDFMSDAFLIRQLPPYFFNMTTRVVKSPKVYVRDSGVMHHLLGVENIDDLFENSKMGASWEGFVIEQIAALIQTNRKLYFYRTHDGSELDLVIEKGGKPLAGIEIKFGSDVRPNKGNTMAIMALKTKNNFVVVNSDEEYDLSKGFKVVGLKKFLTKYLPDL